MLARLTDRLEEGALALLLGAMTVLTFVTVVLRYVFNSNIIWSQAATLYMFGWLVLIGISYGIRANAHIGIDLAVKMIPPGPRRVVGMIGVLLCLVYAGLMTYGSYRYIALKVRRGTIDADIPAPEWLLKIILPLGFALLALRLLQVAIATLRGDRYGLQLADEATDTLREHGVTASEPARDRTAR